MPYEPRALWATLSPALPAGIRVELAAIVQEGIDGQRRGPHAPAAGPQSGHRPAAVDAPPGAQESRRLQAARTARARALGWAAEAMDVLETAVGHSAARAQ